MDVKKDNDRYTRVAKSFFLEPTKKNLFISLIVGAIPTLTIFWICSLKPAIEIANGIVITTETSSLLDEIWQNPYFLTSIFLFILFVPILMIMMGYFILALGRAARYIYFALIR